MSHIKEQILGWFGINCACGDIGLINDNNSELKYCNLTKSQSIQNCQQPGKNILSSSKRSLKKNIYDKFKIENHKLQTNNQMLGLKKNLSHKHTSSQPNFKQSLILPLARSYQKETEKLDSEVHLTLTPDSHHSRQLTKLKKSHKIINKQPNEAENQKKDKKIQQQNDELDFSYEYGKRQKIIISNPLNDKFQKIFNNEEKFNNCQRGQMNQSGSSYKQNNQVMLKIKSHKISNLFLLKPQIESLRGQSQKNQEVSQIIYMPPSIKLQNLNLSGGKSTLEKFNKITLQQSYHTNRKQFNNIIQSIFM